MFDKFVDYTVHSKALSADIYSGLLQTLFYLSSEIVKDANYGQIKVPDKFMLRRKDRKSVVILERICSNSTKLCYTISDSLDFSRRSFSRSLNIKDTEDEFETLVALKVHTGVTGIGVRDSDTRVWEVDHAKLQVEYIAAMITVSFATSAFNVAEGPDSKSVVAVIGLGGGSLSMFLYKKFPDLRIVVVEIDPTVIEVARRWFGVVNNENHRVITADGINFVMEAAHAGIHFDVIFLDACGNDKTLSCPVTGFLDDAVLESVARKLITPAGVFVFNLLPVSLEETMVNVVLNKLSNHFSKCWALTMIKEANTVITCSGNNTASQSLSHSNLSDRIARFWKDLEFDNMFGSDRKFTVIENI